MPVSIFGSGGRSTDTVKKKQLIRVITESGDFSFDEEEIAMLAVGAGAGGNTRKSGALDLNGASGIALFVPNIKVTPGKRYSAIIGKGGEPGMPGMPTTMFGITADGGSPSQISTGKYGIGGSGTSKEKGESRYASTLNQSGFSQICKEISQSSDFASVITDVENFNKYRYNVLRADDLIDYRKGEILIPASYGDCCEYKKGKNKHTVGDASPGGAGILGDGGDTSDLQDKVGPKGGDGGKGGGAGGGAYREIDTPGQRGQAGKGGDGCVLLFAVTDKWIDPRHYIRFLVESKVDNLEYTIATNGVKGSTYNWDISVDDGEFVNFAGSKGTTNMPKINLGVAGFHLVTIKAHDPAVGWAKCLGNGGATNYFTTTNCTLRIVHDPDYGQLQSETMTGDEMRRSQYRGVTNLIYVCSDDMPDTVTTIGSFFKAYCFDACTNLLEAQAESIPDSVTSIGTYFRHCQSQNCTSMLQAAEESMPNSVASNPNFYRGYQYNGCVNLTNPSNNNIIKLPIGEGGTDYRAGQYNNTGKHNVTSQYVKTLAGVDVVEGSNGIPSSFYS